jgi:hypothetical protein
MASPRYHNGRFRDGGFHLSFIQAAMALSVIAGLLFVTLRIMSMPEVANQVPDTPEAAAQTDTVVVKTEASPLGPETSQARNP